MQPTTKHAFAEWLAASDEMIAEYGAGRFTDADRRFWMMESRRVSGLVHHANDDESQASAAQVARANAAVENLFVWMVG
jgi:hypothetical protein